jgi:hypothetical protein
MNPEPTLTGKVIASVTKTETSLTITFTDGTVLKAQGEWFGLNAGELDVDVAQGETP